MPNIAHSADLPWAADQFVITADLTVLIATPAPYASIKLACAAVRLTQAQFNNLCAALRAAVTRFKVAVIAFLTATDLTVTAAR